MFNYIFFKSYSFHNKAWPSIRCLGAGILGEKSGRWEQVRKHWETRASTNLGASRLSEKVGDSDSGSPHQGTSIVLSKEDTSKQNYIRDTAHFTPHLPLTEIISYDFMNDQK